MEWSRKPTKLELHRAQFHRFGKKMPMIPHSMLSEEETRLIADDVMGRMRSRAKVLDLEAEQASELYYSVYAETLADWGVMCPHPNDKRLYSGEKSFAESTDHRWFECKMCKCPVFNPLWKGDPKPFQHRSRMFTPKLRKTPGRDDGDSGGAA